MKKIFFVTGATAGFGKATSEKLISEGHVVVGCGRRAERLEAMRNELGDRFHPLAFDIQSKEAIADAINSLPAELKEIDALVNNEGLAVNINSLEVMPVAQSFSALKVTRKAKD